jgi:hypothetical protein
VDRIAVAHTVAEDRTVAAHIALVAVHIAVVPVHTLIAALHYNPAVAGMVVARTIAVAGWDHNS